MIIILGAQQRSLLTMATRIIRDLSASPFLSLSLYLIAYYFTYQLFHCFLLLPLPAIFLSSKLSRSQVCHLSFKSYLVLYTICSCASVVGNLGKLHYPGVIQSIFLLVFLFGASEIWYFLPGFIVALRQIRFPSFFSSKEYYRLPQNASSARRSYMYILLKCLRAVQLSRVIYYLQANFGIMRLSADG